MGESKRADWVLTTMLTCGTGTLLSGVLFLLVQNPVHMERLKNEVRGQGPTSTLTFERLAGLKYLNACMYHELLSLVTFNRSVRPNLY